MEDNLLNVNQSNPKRLDFICFGGVDWWYHNRGHFDFQLMRRLAKRGTVLFINSIVMQKPKISHHKEFFQKLFRKTKSIFTGLKQVEADLWVYSPFSLPAYHTNLACLLNERCLRFQISLAASKLRLHEPVVWVAIPNAFNLVIKMRKSKLVYQRTDRFEDTPFVDSNKIIKFDQALKKIADITIYVNKALYEKEKSQCKNAFYLDHGVDYENFSTADQNLDIPVDIASIPKPIVGYLGTVEELKLDKFFLEKVADYLPHISFVFVGEVKPQLSCLAKRKNIWLLGQKSYEQMPLYGKCFDVAMIPWRKNQWTEAANPIKLKEYLALGKPIVCTPVFTEIQEYIDVVYKAETPEEFAENIMKAIEQDNSLLIMKRREKVKASSWDTQAERVIEKLFNS